MKKLFLLVAVVSIALTGCGKIEDAIDKLENRLDNLEQEKIPTIDEQISAINTTLSTLDAMDKELKCYIDGLQVTADNLQKQINDTNTKIDAVKAELEGEISAAKADVLAQSEYKRDEKLAKIEEVSKIYDGIIERGECLSLKELAVNGKDLMDCGISPGKEIGEILEYFLEMVIADPSLNKKEILLNNLPKK